MYATINDIQTRWRTLTAEEQDKAAALISDASTIIDSMAGASFECGEDWDAKAKIVCCNMVIRAMGASDTFGVKQQSMTAGPYTEQWTFANPSGDMYLTRMEKRMLGITQGYIGSIRAKVGCDD